MTLTLRKAINNILVSPSSTTPTAKLPLADIGMRLVLMREINKEMENATSEADLSVILQAHQDNARKILKLVTSVNRNKLSVEDKALQARIGYNALELATMCIEATAEIASQVQ